MAATGAVALAPLAPLFATLLPACPLHQMTGVPCPSCGVTRAALDLAHGQLLAALAVNPLAGGGMAFGVLGGLLSPAWVAVGAPLPRVKAERRWRWLVAAALAANWIYLIVRGV
jgi:hypothetical protein